MPILLDNFSHTNSTSRRNIKNTKPKPTKNQSHELIHKIPFLVYLLCSNTHETQLRNKHTCTKRHKENNHKNMGDEVDEKARSAKGV
jgi:hypothetical protein